MSNMEGFNKMRNVISLVEKINSQRGRYTDEDYELVMQHATELSFGDLFKDGDYAPLEAVKDFFGLTSGSLLSARTSRRRDLYKRAGWIRSTEYDFLKDKIDHVRREDGRIYMHMKDGTVQETSFSQRVYYTRQCVALFALSLQNPRAKALRSEIESVLTRCQTERSVDPDSHYESLERRIDLLEGMNQKLSTSLRYLYNAISTVVEHNREQERVFAQLMSTTFEELKISDVFDAATEGSAT